MWKLSADNWEIKHIDNSTMEESRVPISRGKVSEAFHAISKKYSIECAIDNVTDGSCENKREASNNKWVRFLFDEMKEIPADSKRGDNSKNA